MAALRLVLVLGRLIAVCRMLIRKAIIFLPAVPESKQDFQLFLSDHQ
jgi:hypothetical protein